jgi:uncharacterized protein involved in exopolysaccharide biosynthesis
MAESEVNNSGSGMSYDPYFIPTTFEILQSQLVLSNAIATLNLNEAWGRKYFNGKTLKTAETMEIIKRRMNLAPVRGTKLIAISFTSEDPNEAAKVPNAIAEAYRDFRINQRRELIKKGLEILQWQFQDEEKKISVQQTNVEQLRQKFGIQDTASTNKSPEQQPYWDEKRKLDQMIEVHRLLGAKIIETAKLNLQIPKTSMVQITDLAEPPKFPTGPNRSLGVCLIVAGLSSMIAGWLLLKPSGQQAD